METNTMSFRLQLVPTAAPAPQPVVLTAAERARFMAWCEHRERAGAGLTNILAEVGEAAGKVRLWLLSERVTP